MTDQRRVLVLGATGYVGGLLVPLLLDAGWQVRCLSRYPGKVAARPWAQRVDVVAGDLLERGGPRVAVGAVDTLVHLARAVPGSPERDRRMARAVAKLAAEAGARRIVHLACLGAAEQSGGALMEGPVPATVLRSAPIIGPGSAAFDALRSLAEQPVVPRLANASLAPVAVQDVLRCLIGALDEADDDDRVRDVTGPGALAFRQLLEVCARVVGSRRRVVVAIPLPSARLASVWTSLATPLPLAVAAPLVRSFAGATGGPEGSQDGTRSARVGYEAALQHALACARAGDVETSWRDAGAMPEPHQPGREDGPEDDRERDPTRDPKLDPTPDPVASGVHYTDVRRAVARATPEALFAAVCAVGGDRGWPTQRWAWWVRGLLDRLIGGVGLRRGRRVPDDLRVGDALDFWRVEALRRPGGDGAGVLRLAAELWLPGLAWLEWRVEPGDRREDGGDAVLVQRASFAPRGVLGRLYWAAMWPFHGLIFGSMARALARQAEALAGGLTSNGARTAPPEERGDPVEGSGPPEPPARRAG